MAMERKLAGKESPALDHLDSGDPDDHDGRMVYWRHMMRGWMTDFIGDDASCAMVPLPDGYRIYLTRRQVEGWLAKQDESVLADDPVYVELLDKVLDELLYWADAW